jgi:hypothetical protein
VDKDDFKGLRQEELRWVVGVGFSQTGYLAKRMAEIKRNSLRFSNYSTRSRR